MAHTYLVSFGAMRSVAPFGAIVPDYGRGQRVVLRSARGLELGEVLTTTTAARAAPGVDIVRAALPDDLERADRQARERQRLMGLCEEVIESSPGAGLALLDLDVTLDAHAVVYVLGPDVGQDQALLAALQDRLGVPVLLERVGGDNEPLEDEPGCGTCGSCASSRSGPEAASRAHARGSDCAGCGLKGLVHC